MKAPKFSNSVNLPPKVTYDECSSQLREEVMRKTIHTLTANRKVHLCALLIDNGQTSSKQVRKTLYSGTLRKVEEMVYILCSVVPHHIGFHGGRF